MYIYRSQENMECPIAPRSHNTILELQANYTTPKKGQE